MLELAATDWDVLTGEAPARPSLVNVPNAITLGGYASTVAWLGGASPWFAVVGVFADEADGPMARRLGQESEYGSLFDWACDIALTTAIAIHMGGAWIVLAPVVIATQTWLRLQGHAPPFGSARAALTAIALV